MSIRCLSGYFFSEFLRPFFICTLGFVMIFLLVTIQNELPKNISAIEIFLFLLGSLLIKFNYIMSCSFFISGIYFMFQVNLNNELVACQAAGVHQLKALAKIFYFCLFVMICLFIIHTIFSPKIEKYNSSLHSKLADSKINSRVFYKQYLNNKSFRLWSFLTDKDEKVRDLSIIEKKDGEIVQQYLSPTASYKNNQWVLDTPIVLFGGILKKHKLLIKDLGLDYHTIVQNNLLFHSSKKNKALYSKRGQRKYEIDYYAQLLSPLLCVSLLLLGLTFSMQNKRQKFHISYPFIAVLVFVFVNRLLIIITKKLDFLPIIPMLLLATITVIIWRGKKIV